MEEGGGGGELYSKRYFGGFNINVLHICGFFLLLNRIDTFFKYDSTPMGIKKTKLHVLMTATFILTFDGQESHPDKGDVEGVLFYMSPRVTETGVKLHGPDEPLSSETNCHWNEKLLLQ